MVTHVVAELHLHRGFRALQYEVLVVAGDGGAGAAQLSAGQLLGQRALRRVPRAVLPACARPQLLLRVPRGPHDAQHRLLHAAAVP